MSSRGEAGESTATPTPTLPTSASSIQLSTERGPNVVMVGNNAGSLEEGQGLKVSKSTENLSAFTKVTSKKRRNRGGGNPSDHPALSSSQSVGHAASAAPPMSQQQLQRSSSQRQHEQLSRQLPSRQRQRKPMNRQQAVTSPDSTATTTASLASEGVHGHATLSAPAASLTTDDFPDLPSSASSGSLSRGPGGPAPTAAAAPVASWPALSTVSSGGPQRSTSPPSQAAGHHQSKQRDSDSKPAVITSSNNKKASETSQSSTTSVPKVQTQTQQQQRQQQGLDVATIEADANAAADHATGPTEQQAATDKATAAQSSIQPQPQMSSASIIDHHIQQGAAAVASSQLPSPIRASSSNNNNFNPNSFNPHLQHNNPVTFEVVPSSSGLPVSSDENPAVSAGLEFMGPPSMALLYPGAPPQGFQVGGPGVVSGTDQGQAGPHPMQLGLAASNAVEMPSTFR